MPDFTRINTPRVEKITAMIATILKSARSQRIADEDVAALLAPVSDQLAVLFECDGTPAPAAPVEPVGATTSIKPPTTLRDAPHVHQIAGFVAALPSEQLPSYITHLVNRLCEQAEQAKAA